MYKSVVSKLALECTKEIFIKFIFILRRGQTAFKGSLSPSKNKNKSDKDFYCTLHKFVLMRFIQRNRGHRDSVMHEFHSNVNKVNRAVAKGYLENMECGILEWNGLEWIGMALLIDLAVIVARTVENDT